MRWLLPIVLLLLPALAKAEPLIITTGAPQGTYYRFGADIAWAARAGNIDVKVIPSGGSIENAERITNPGVVSLGIVQSDVLGAMSRSSNPETTKRAAKLRMVMPLFAEEVHVLARRDINDIRALSGRRVAVGLEGSGSELTAINLFSILNIRPSAMLHLSPDEGIIAVLDGSADAMLFVGGKPVPVFKNLEKLTTANDAEDAALLEQLHFLPLADDALMSEYVPSSITPDDYRFVKAAIPTIAATAVLVDFDFSERATAYQQARCSQITTLVRSIMSVLGTLRSNGHPKWKEVNPMNELALWKKDSCAAVASAPAAQPAGSSLKKDLMGVVRSAH